MFGKSIVIKSLIALALIFSVACAEIKDRAPAGQNDEMNACTLFFNQSGYCAKLIFEHTPSDTERGVFVLEFRRQDEPTLPADPPNAVGVMLLMTGMDHRQSPTVTRINPGQYRVDDAAFVMRGPWEIHVQLKDGRGDVVEEDTYKYNRP